MVMCKLKQLKQLKWESLWKQKENATKFAFSFGFGPFFALQTR